MRTTNGALPRRFRTPAPAAVRGLRHRDVVHCAHAQKPPAGCGTTRHCASCGAAIATVTAIATNRTAERTCALEFLKNGSRSEASLRVRASPLTIGDHRFFLRPIPHPPPLQACAAAQQLSLHDAASSSGAPRNALHLLCRAAG